MPVIYIWHENQRVPAGLYNDHHFDGTAEIVVSDHPTIRTDLSRGVVRYHFGASGGGGAGRR